MKIESQMPIGVTPLKTRWYFTKSLIWLAFRVLIGDEWTKNIAYDKKVEITFTVTSSRRRGK